MITMVTTVSAGLCLAAFACLAAVMWCWPADDSDEDHWASDNPED